jgi:hypothetical protein
MVTVTRSVTKTLPDEAASVGPDATSAPCLTSHQGECPTCSTPERCWSCVPWTKTDQRRGSSDAGGLPGLLEAERWPVTSDKKELEFPAARRCGDQRLAVAAVVALVLWPVQTGQVSWRHAASQNIHSQREAVENASCLRSTLPGSACAARRSRIRFVVIC